jgi:hypothetical protein
MENGQGASGPLSSLATPAIRPDLHARPEHCVNCPITEGLYCPGEDARRLCMLVDPEHPEFTPEYVATIRGLARPRGADERRPDLAEALSLIGAMKACPFRKVDTNCGCAGAKCSLRRGSVVSYPECFDCLRQYGGNHDT